jgi:hypothetical protein
LFASATGRIPALGEGTGGFPCNLIVIVIVILIGLAAAAVV